MTQGRNQDEYTINKEEIRKLIRETMLSEEEIDKNIEEFSKILQLFEQIDEFRDHIQNLSPLYHPMDLRGEPRQDYVDDRNKVNVEEFVRNIKDGFVKSPRL